jgi:hypothetical protein
MNPTQNPSFSPLDAVLAQQYEPELLLKHLDESLRAVVFHALTGSDLSAGTNADEAMNIGMPNHFEAVLALRTAVSQMVAPNYRILEIESHGDS